MNLELKRFLICTLSLPWHGREMDPDLWLYVLEFFTTMSVRVSSGVPNTKKQMKARGCRPSAFIVSRC